MLGIRLGSKLGWVESFFGGACRGWMKADSWRAEGGGGGHLAWCCRTCSLYVGLADSSLPSQTKYTTALRDHTATITHMQRELESLRASEKTLRTQLRDTELNNDDLEKSER